MNNSIHDTTEEADNDNDNTMIMVVVMIVMTTMTTMRVTYNCAHFNGIK